MVNTHVRSWWFAGVWSAVVVAMTSASVAMRADASTSVLLAAVALSPVVVVFFLGDAASASPSVAQILHAEHPKDGRS